MKLFGWSITKTPEDALPSFAPQVHDDGAVVVSAGGTYGTYVDMEGTVKTEAELVTKYRDMVRHPEIDDAVTNIVNEAIVQEDGKEIVQINFDKLQLPPKVQQAIEGEFERVKELLDFNNHAHDIFNRFYVDGRMYYHAIIDEKVPQAGLQELRYIDPRKIRKVREVDNKNVSVNSRVPGSEGIQKVKNEYFIFNPNGFAANVSPTQSYAQTAQGLKIAKDAILHVTSGITDANGSLVLGQLHKAIKPLNQLRALEDAAIIYRLARAPERRIFYIDVGNLPKPKAEQYLRDMMTKYKNKLVYDSATGEVRDDRKFMTMLEDFWLPRREGGKGTEIDTLPAGNSQGVMEEVEFFKDRLLASLNVPSTRSNPDAIFSVGPGTSEITRDEIKFAKFIDRQRLRFNQVFLGALEKQLILKQVILPEEWPAIAYRLKFVYARDNLYSELKDIELGTARFNMLMLMAPFVGRFYSNDWIMKNVLKLSDEEIEMMREQILDEAMDPIFNPPAPPDEGGGNPGGFPGADPQGKGQG